MKNLHHHATYRKIHVVCVQHTAGSSLVRLKRAEYEIAETNHVVLGGHIPTAESADTKDHTGRMAALFAHQGSGVQQQSQQYLEKMAARRVARGSDNPHCR